MDAASAISRDVRFIAKHHDVIRGKLLYALQKAKHYYPNTDRVIEDIVHKHSPHCRMVLQIPSRKIIITVSGEQNIPDRALRMMVFHNGKQVYGFGGDEVIDRDKGSLKKEWNIFLKEVDDAQKLLWKLRGKLD